LYASYTDTLRQEGSFLHDRTLPFVVPKWKSLEIDDLTDFLLVEAIMDKLSLIKGEHATAGNVAR
jgi:CMP-N,N'-diacetyllegionaminic acid synthase